MILRSAWFDSTACDYANDLQALREVQGESATGPVLALLLHPGRQGSAPHHEQVREPWIRDWPDGWTADTEATDGSEAEDEGEDCGDAGEGQTRRESLASERREVINEKA